VITACSKNLCYDSAFLVAMNCFSVKSFNTASLKYSFVFATGTDDSLLHETIMSTIQMVENIKKYFFICFYFKVTSNGNTPVQFDLLHFVSKNIFRSYIFYRCSLYFRVSKCPDMNSQVWSAAILFLPKRKTF
jgi:hypothetical protein